MGGRHTYYWDICAGETHTQTELYVWRGYVHTRRCIWVYPRVSMHRGECILGYVWDKHTHTHVPTHTHTHTPQAVCEGDDTPHGVVHIGVGGHVVIYTWRRHNTLGYKLGGIHIAGYTLETPRWKMMRTYHIKTYTGSTPRRVIYTGVAYMDINEGGFTPGYAGHTNSIPEVGAQI